MAKCVIPVLLSWSLVACNTGTVTEDTSLQSAAWQWQLPANFPVPFVPADNPMTTAKVELGRHLFYDLRLSGNGTQACGTCHLQ
ncbi:MAG TPA: cytochrome c peroxidase, partial [Agitococcus sp.]|nr:cytochrome c peroxidase [Agitococcus sp.]